MGAVLNLVQDNLHELRVDETRMLFHIPSSSLFALDPLGAATAAFLIAWGGVKLLGSIANAASEAGLSWLRIKLTAKEADNGKD